MSRQTIRVAIETLLSDESTRLQFAIDPFQTLADLGSRGVELTPDEMDALMGADLRIWFGSAEQFNGRTH